MSDDTNKTDEPTTETTASKATAAELQASVGNPERDWDATPLSHDESVYVTRLILTSGRTLRERLIIAAKGRAHITYGAEPMAWSAYVTKVLDMDLAYARRILSDAKVAIPSAVAADVAANIDAGTEPGTQQRRESAQQPFPEMAKRGTAIVRALNTLDLSDVNDEDAMAAASFAASLIGHNLRDANKLDVSSATLDAAIVTVKLVGEFLDAVAESLRDAVAAQQQPEPSSEDIAAAAKAA